MNEADRKRLARTYMSLINQYGFFYLGEDGKTKEIKPQYSSTADWEMWRAMKSDA